MRAPIVSSTARRAERYVREVQNPEEVFGKDVYVGHDEPSVLFYSNEPGSGNRMTYQLTLPTDPKVRAGNTFNFELHPAFWFGMALCDTQSFPEQVATCTPDSDKNITKDLAQRPGNAFMELQFYAPGWVPQPVGFSCDATQWCVAMVTFGVAVDPIKGTFLNPTCASMTGIEYANFAYLTKNGRPQPNSPPNPVDATLQTFTVDPNADLFMNSGDRLKVTLHDTEHGLFIGVNDLTTKQSGSMTASAANGFGSPRYAPTGASCDLVPMDFHPMYSTSSEQTRVIWAAHSYNVAFSDEIGHFDYCSQVTDLGDCAPGATEGSGRNKEPTEGPPTASNPFADDYNCFRASDSSRVPVSGCLALGGNTGFDGVSYQPVWPDGNGHHPTSMLFTSPLTGEEYSQNYSRLAFEADLPRIEEADFGGSCDPSNGVGCTRIPPTDDGAPATFYPFYSTQSQSDQCVWALGNVNPGVTTDDFGQNNEWGSLLFLPYLQFDGGGATVIQTNNYRQVLDENPCPAQSEEDASSK